MMYEDFLSYMQKLEAAYEKELGSERLTVYYQNFERVGEQDFERVVQYCIKHLERFPSIASIYKAMDTLGVSNKKRIRPVIPYIHYEDEQQRAYSLWNSTGESFNPPEVIKEKDGRILKRVR